MASAKSRETATITEFDAVTATGDLTMVADGTGRENGAPVIVRTTVTLRGTALSISRASRKPGEPFLMRDAYAFTPAGPQ